MIIVYFNDKYCYKWKKTFAFLPVKTISGHRVWLKTVYKRRGYIHDDEFKVQFEKNYLPTKQYGTVLDLLSDPYIPYITVEDDL